MLFLRTRGQKLVLEGGLNKGKYSVPKLKPGEILALPKLLRRKKGAIREEEDRKRGRSIIVFLKETCGKTSVFVRKNIIAINCQT